ncbi:omega-amidase [termite gut metagenome]|uniref:Omega-amidase n=1 Tax=termite gut metagenome TaxID=433724 RepID=A0A5J4RDV9_9ZZZZ
MEAPLRISIVQTDIVWEDKQANLHCLYEKLEPLSGTTDLVVLPEMFSTGFSMESRLLAEPVSGNTITTLKKQASYHRFAIAGSYIATENDAYYNRGFFLTPHGEAFFYDKHHLFRPGKEYEHFSSGNRKVIIPYREWNICLMICYDLRFPVWSRNVNNEYDLLIYVANWPSSRRQVWDTLLQARAIENLSYVCGVNRVGNDRNILHYDGGSAIYSPRGEKLTAIPNGKEAIETISLDLASLQLFRERFSVWKDADSFTLT